MSVMPSSGSSVAIPCTLTCRYHDSPSNTVSETRGFARMCWRRFRPVSRLTRMRPPSHRYHVATVTGVPSARTVPMTAGFGLFSTSIRFAGIGGLATRAPRRSSSRCATAIAAAPFRVDAASATALTGSVDHDAGCGSERWGVEAGVPVVGWRLRLDDGPDGFGFDLVAVAGGRLPGEVSGPGLGQLPTGVRLAVVAALAEHPQVARRSGPTRLAGRGGVVRLASRRRLRTRRETARPVPDADVVGKLRRRRVPGLPVVQKGTGGRVGKDAPPGAVGGDPPSHGRRDRPVPGQLGRRLVD